MKTLRMIGMALFAVLMCVNFASCSSEEDVEPNEPKEYTVSLGFTGEISISETPLSRTIGNDIYGIQVYSCPISKESTTYNYTHYAYGTFDDLTKMSIKLVEGYKYKFVASMVVDAKEKIGHSEEGSYYAPFDVRDGSSYINNSFNYSNTSYFMHLETGTSNLLSEQKSFARPNVDRYYGQYIDYTPTENGKVNIEMLRVVHGLKIITENMTEGTLNIAMEAAPEMNIIAPETETNDIFTFLRLDEPYLIEDYSVNIPTTFTWTKADGAIIPFGTHDITFKRNKRVIVTIKISDISSDNTIGVTLENGEMTDENVTIENGEIVDTNVDTETEG